MLSAQCSADGSVLSHRRRQHRLPPRSWSRSRHWSRAKATGSGWAPRAPCAACTAPATRHTRLDTATRRELRSAALRCAPLRSLVEGDSPLEHRLGTVRLGAELRLQHPRFGAFGAPASAKQLALTSATRRSPEAEPEGRRSSPWALIPKGERELETLGLPTLLWSLLGVGPSSCESPRKP